MQYKHIPMKYDLPEVGIAKGQTEVGGVEGGGGVFPPSLPTATGSLLAGDVNGEEAVVSPWLSIGSRLTAVSRSRLHRGHKSVFVNPCGGAL